MRDIAASLLKGPSGIFAAYVLFYFPSLEDVFSIAKVCGGALSAIILIFTVGCVVLDFKHKLRRDAREKTEGYLADPEQDE